MRNGLAAGRAAAAPHGGRAAMHVSELCVARARVLELNPAAVLPR